MSILRVALGRAIGSHGGHAAAGVVGATAVAGHPAAEPSSTARVARRYNNLSAISGQPSVLKLKLSADG